MSVSTADAPISTTEAAAQLRSAGISLREETPGVVLSTKSRREFPGPSRGRRVRRYHATDDPYIVKEEEEGSAEDPLEPLLRELSELQTEDEGLFESKPTAESIETAKVPEVPREVEEKPKRKRAKNKITLEAEPSPRESRYAHLLKSESEE